MTFCFEKFHSRLLIPFSFLIIQGIFPVADTAHKTASELQDDTKDQPATSDAPSELPDISLPPAPDNSRADSPDHSEPSSKRLSNISSDFDSADRISVTSSGHNQDSEGEVEGASAQPHLMVVHVTSEGTQEQHGVHHNASCATCVTQGNSCNQEQSVTSPDGCATYVMEAEFSNSPESHTALDKTDGYVSPASANVSEDTLSADNSLCMDSVSLSRSTLMEDDLSVDDVTLGPDESHTSDYLPDIYSNTPVNISDATFSDVSVEKSHRSKPRPSKLTGLGSTSSLKTSSDGPTDSEGTPPVSLDSEGAEELSDTASWPRTPSRRTMSDIEIVNHEDAPPLEGSFSSTSSGSSLPRSPGSTKQGLRLLADSWADYSPPGQGYVQFVAVSDTHIWCVTTYDHIYYCPTHFSVVTWTQLKGSARMIAVNNTGDVIWSIDRKNYANARTGINANHLTGKKWQPVEKDMRYVALEGTALWGIKVSHR